MPGMAITYQASAEQYCPNRHSVHLVDFAASFELGGIDPIWHGTQLLTESLEKIVRLI